MATADEPVLLDFLGGERFKGYEADAQSYLSGPYAALRVDGRGFSRLTRAQGYAVPYDLNFMGAMDAVAKALLKLVEGAHFSYVQSDEVSVVFSPVGPSDRSAWWHGGKVQKIISLAAAQASVSFLRAELLRDRSTGVEPLFDARVSELRSAPEVEQYLRWRRFDAQKNSVSMAAETLYSHRELHGVSSKDRSGLLKGTELERLPDGFYNGRIFYRTKVQGTAWNPVLEQTVPVERTVIESHAADRSFLERALSSLVAERSYTERNGEIDG